MTLAIETDELTKQFGDIVAVNQLSLSVEDGEIYGFLGPNGAGKSTTINLLMDYLRPDSGNVRIYGSDPRKDGPTIRQQVGILPDGFTPYDERTAQEHVRLVAATKNVDTDPASLLSRVGLNDAIDQSAGSFSRGMTQRLGLAMAIVGDPQLLILDEPFQGLDPRGVQTMRTLIHNLNAEGTTVFFSSHVLGQVEIVGDRIGILHDGSLAAEGSKTELQQAAGLGDALHVSTDGSLSSARQAVSELNNVVHIITEPDTLIVQLNKQGEEASVRNAIEQTSQKITQMRRKQPPIESIFLAHTEAPESVMD